MPRTSIDDVGMPSKWPLSVLSTAWIAAYGLALNAMWEFAHAGLLYDMWDEVSVSKGLFHITFAIVGDAVVILILAAVACFLVGSRHIVDLDGKGCLALLSLGFVTALGLEWFALLHDWWTYNERMPVFTIFGESVGLSPVLQITVTPAASVYFAGRHVRFGRHSRS